MGFIADQFGYFIGQCTGFVAETLGWIPRGLGNAGTWLERAPSHGLQTTSIPTVGSVAVMPHVGDVGHVGIVQAVKGGLVTIKDQNWDLHSGKLIHDVNVGSIAGYILAPGMAAGNAAAASGASIPNPADALGAALSGLGNAIGAGFQGAGNAIGAGITGSVTSTGHGLANSISSSLHNLEIFASTQAVALIVAAVVVLVVFMS